MFLYVTNISNGIKMQKEYRETDIQEDYILKLSLVYNFIKSNLTNEEISFIESMIKPM